MILAGCGGGDSAPSTTGSRTAPGAAGSASLAGLSATEVLAKTRAAALSRESVRVRSSGTQNGDRLQLDVRVNETGGTGTLTIDGSDFTLVRLGDVLYLKGDRAFYEAVLTDEQKGLIPDLLTKYVKGPVTDARLAGFAELVHMSAGFEAGLKPDGTLTVVSGKEIEGVRTVGLLDTAEGERSTLYVADDGTNLPMVIETDPANRINKTRTTFSEWDSEVDITAPNAGEVIDVSSLDG